MATAPKGRNLAVTKDGASYNKLSRPDDLTDPAPNSSSAAPPMDSAKRKLEELGRSNASTDDGNYRKRARPSELPTQEEYDETAASAPKREPIINMRKSIKPKLPARNEKYGQAQGIGSGLDEWDDGSATDGSTNEAMRYLRSVRQEAEALPVLVTAPAPEVSDEDSEEAIYKIGDSRAVFRDGVCMAARSDVSEVAGSATVISPQGASRAMLLRRLRGLRDSMSDTPPSNALDRLHASSKAPTAFPRLNHAAVVKWTTVLKYTFPAPAQLSQMSQAVVLHLIAVAVECLKPNRNITPQLSCWIWSIFGRLGERGTLLVDDDYVVRELGKAAVALRLSYLGYNVDGPSLIMEDSEEMLGEDEAEADEAWDPEQDGYDDKLQDEDIKASVPKDSGDLVLEDERDDIVNKAEDVKTTEPPGLAQPVLVAPKDDQPTIIESIESARARLLSTLASVSPAPESKADVAPQPKRKQRRTKSRKELRIKAAEREREEARHTRARTNHRRNGPSGVTSNRSSYDHGRRMSSVSQSQSYSRRSASTAHTTGNADRGSQNGDIGDSSRTANAAQGGQKRRRNTSSPESSPDCSRVRRNTSSPKASPGPYRRLPRASTSTAQMPFPSRAEAEAARKAREERGVGQLDGPDERDLDLADGGVDVAVGVGAEETNVEDGEGKKVEEGEVGEEVPNFNTLATLDMIITVVGERYGQRDLLEAREVWG